MEGRDTSPSIIEIHLKLINKEAKLMTSLDEHHSYDTCNCSYGDLLRPKNQHFQQNHGNTGNWNGKKATQYSNQFNRSDSWQSPLDQWSPQHDDSHTKQWRWFGCHRRWLWFVYYTHGIYLSIFTYLTIELAYKVLDKYSEKLYLSL